MRLKGWSASVETALAEVTAASFAEVWPLVAVGCYLVAYLRSFIGTSGEGEY